MGDTKQKELLNYREAAELLTVGEETLRHWAPAGKVPYLKLGYHVRFSRRQLEQWIEDQKQGPKAGRVYRPENAEAEK